MILTAIAAVFLKLGTIAFGGPAAHIAMMEDEVVRRRKWLTRDEFLDYLGATNLIPGPNSTELAIHIGRVRGGWPGLVVAGTCFILPAAIIVSAIAWIYVRFGSLPEVSSILYGVKPVVIAVVLQALSGLGRSAVKTRVLALIGIASVVAVIAGCNEIAVLIGAGIVASIVAAPRAESASREPVGHGVSVSPLLPGAAAPMALGTAGTVAFGLWPLFFTFAKIGAVLFGSGYVLLAFLRADLVQRLGWLTEQQLLDAVAVGQVTPGPVFTTATFIGYVLGGVPGAVVATVGIFLPAFVFVALSGPIVPRLRRSRIASAALDAVNAASLGLMALVSWQLARASLVNWTTLMIALGAALLLATRRVNAAWIVVAGGIVGVALGS